MEQISTLPADDFPKLFLTTRGVLRTNIVYIVSAFCFRNGQQKAEGYLHITKSNSYHKGETYK